MTSCRSCFSSNRGREIPIPEEGYFVAGGAIIVMNCSLGVTICNSLFHNNSATNFGGAFFADSSPITIVNGTFNNNTVTQIGWGGVESAYNAPPSPLSPLPLYPIPVTVL